MSDLLSIGASGVRAYQTALGVTGDNIANAGTAGYSRRVATLKEVTPAGAIGLTSTIARPGQGVVVDGIGRAADAYKGANVRTASSDLARTEAGSTWLTRVQSVLTQNDTGKAMSGFFAAAQKLAADPTSIAARSATIESAKATAQSFRSTAAALDAAQGELDSVTTDTTRQITALATALTKVNDGLGRVAPDTATSANLLDSRDRLLDQMSALTDTTAQFDSVGRVAVRVGGAQGPLLVQGKDAATVEFNRNDDGTTAFIVRGQGADTGFTPTGGALAGFAEGALRIAGTRTQLETVASGFATAVNDQMTAGDDLDGNDGTALFAVPASPAPSTGLTVAFDDPRLLAAAARDGGPRDASNLVALQSVRRTSKVEDGMTAITAGVAAAIDSRATVAAAQGSIRDAAVAQRDAVSGVDLDKEAVDLLRFQQAYQASSRVIQVARDTIQSILAIN